MTGDLTKDRFGRFKEGVDQFGANGSAPYI